jgi:ubiquinone/menaquinone biosynthesis C-methylase UbiE/diadenosine tetraphosphate (Ap4A) HIT family hydrolase
MTEVKPAAYNTTSRLDVEQIVQTHLAYERIAKDYAETWFDDPVMKPTLERFLSVLPEPASVLDAGCGPGRDVLEMARRGIDVVGIDFSQAMIAESRARAPTCIFRRMDMRSVKFPSESFAGIWACASLQHIPAGTAIQVLAEFARVLKPGGLIWVIVEEGQGEKTDHLGRYQKLYMASELRELISRTGFQILEERMTSSHKVTLGQDSPRRWLHMLATKPASLEPIFLAPERACPFCSKYRFQLGRDAGLPGIGSMIWGDDDVYVAPDIAPLLEGHLLMITSAHYDCYGAFPAASDSMIHNIQRHIRQMFRAAYHAEAIFFEHGPAVYKEAGTCINHAHWHCLPSSLPIRSAVEQRIGPGQAASLNTLHRLYRDQQSYLYIEEAVGSGFVYPIRFLPCQFLREVVASLIGHQNWDWQESFALDESKRVFQRTLNGLLPLADELPFSTPITS